SSGSVAFAAGATFGIDLDGTTPGTDQDQLAVTGTVTLGGATLSLTGLFSSGVKKSYIIIDNDGYLDKVGGTFAGLIEGATVKVNDPKGVAHTFTITYQGGPKGPRGEPGNDVELKRVGSMPPSVTDGMASVNEDNPLRDAVPVAYDPEGEPL